MRLAIVGLRLVSAAGIVEWARMRRTSREIARASRVVRKWRLEEMLSKCQQPRNSKYCHPSTEILRPKT